MSRFTSPVWALVWGLLVGSSGGQGALRASTAGEVIFTSEAARFRLEAKPEGLAQLQIASSPAAPAEPVLRVRTTRRLERGELVRVFAPVESAIEPGDVLLVEFWMRVVEAEEWPGRVEIRFEPGISRFSSPLRMAARAGKQWVRIQYPFYTRRAYLPGEARVEVLLGRQRQTVELAGLVIRNYHRERTKEELPCTRLDYPGSEPDAPWRRAAEERIERYRKADLVVEVRDAAGRPVAGAKVNVALERHAFGFGSAVAAPVLLGRSQRMSAEDVERYRQHVVRLFNKAVLENALKWPQWASPGGSEIARQAVDWLREQGLEVRGHVLVWPSWRWMPPYVAQLQGQPERLRQVIRDHIREETSALRGKIAEWDVLNEPYTNHDVMDLLGREVMVEWFQEARQADPQAALFINDFGILTPGDPAHRDHYEDTIRFLLERGAPLDGIGLQGHFKSEATPPEELLAILDRFARFGKPLQVTEFDMDTVDEQLQADYTRDFLTVVFSHPAVKGFLMWGFWEPVHWIPNGAMFRRDWSPKPNARVYEELVFRRWWTRASGSTGEDGIYRTRGFHGDYRVEVTGRGKTVTERVKLGPPGTRVRVIL